MDLYVVNLHTKINHTFKHENLTTAPVHALFSFVLNVYMYLKTTTICIKRSICVPCNRDVAVKKTKFFSNPCVKHQAFV